MFLESLTLSVTAFTRWCSSGRSRRSRAAPRCGCGCSGPQRVGGPCTCSLGRSCRTCAGRARSLGGACPRSPTCGRTSRAGCECTCAQSSAARGGWRWRACATASPRSCGVHPPPPWPRCACCHLRRHLRRHLQTPPSGRPRGRLGRSRRGSPPS